MDESKGSVETVYDKVNQATDDSEIPITIDGKILKRSALIEDINVADDEVLMYEVAVESDDATEAKSFAFAEAKEEDEAKMQTETEESIKLKFSNLTTGQ